jgi:hypothetical protein
MDHSLTLEGVLASVRELSLVAKARLPSGRVEGPPQLETWLGCAVAA